MTGPDVVVYGATAVGVITAVAAREAGATVVLVGPDRHVGGMVSGGLGWTDVGDTRVLGGLARCFYAAVAEHYDAPLWGVRGPEPHVGEALLVAMLERAGVEVRLGEPLARVDVADGRIARLESDGGAYEAAAFVDAGYEGDLLAAAGVPYAVGRESRDLYGETWAGRQPAWRPGRHNFDVLLSPFADDGTLLPFVREPELDERGWPAERLGEGDGGLQAYCFRVCLTDRDENRVPFERPDGYDPAEFELLRRYLEAAGDRMRARDLLGLVPDLLPNGKCDVNSIGPFSTNVLDGSNRAYPAGGADERARVRAHHLRYTQALLYYLSHDDSVPAHVRRELARWGRCADEFADTQGWPHQLYVRDGRRMLGDYVLRESDLLDARPQDDVVALGSYNVDVREVERTWRYLPEYSRTAAAFNEGYLSVAVPPYPIPFRSLIPRRDDCENLLVPLCLSASHVAFGSVRMEPTLMLLGEAAGAAAAQAARRGVAVQYVDVAALQESLRQAGQVLAV
ncbi:MAG: FAD-dependent oxidoreductase [Thermoleophilia bacterium]|nr:FAD-dependent oxidoreductase [Thermoleophilia bacterium]